jgi:hypothetical protein
MKRAVKFLKALGRNRSGVAAVEFALTLPLLLVAGLGGAETANYVIVNMQVGQLAVHIADNASRIGDTSMLIDRKIYESDINDLLTGANIQGGDRLDIFNNGRVIVSSLETDPAGPDNQYIHWQRCMGTKHYDSSYGVEGDDLASMGPPGGEVVAEEGDAVIFVEISYEYKPLVSAHLASMPMIHTVSSFTVRDSRDLGGDGIFQRNTGSPDPVARCSDYNNLDA